jgi:hypothetical protein
MDAPSSPDPIYEMPPASQQSTMSVTVGGNSGQDNKKRSIVMQEKMVIWGTNISTNEFKSNFAR